MAVPTTARTDEGWAADGGKAPAAQPTPHPHARGGTGAAGRVPAPAFPQWDVGPGHWGRAAEHNPATPVARSKRCLNGRSLQVHEEAVAEDLAALSMEMELQELERSFLARTERRLAELRQGVLWQQQQDGLEESKLQQQEGEEQHFSPMWLGQLDVRPRRVSSFYKLWQPELTRAELPKDATSKQDVLEWLEAHAPSKQRAGAARGAVPQVPAGKPRALAEEDEWEDDSDIELSQRKDIPTYNTWASLLDSELFQDRREDIVAHNIWDRLLVPELFQDQREDFVTHNIWANPLVPELFQDQREDIVTHNIWVNPLVPELFQDPHAGPHERPGWPSSMGTDAAGEAAGDWQSASPAPAGLMDAKLAASALAGAPEDEGHCAPLAPVAQEEAKAPASPVFGEQATAAQAESQAPAPHSPAACAAALQDTAHCIVSKVPGEAVAVIQGPGHQPAEQWDLAQSMDAAMAATTPAAPQDTESPSAGEPQGEASTAPLVPAAREGGEKMASPMSGDHRGEASTAIVSPAAHEGEVASSLPQNPPADAGTPHLALAVDDEGDAAAFPLAWDPWHQEEPGALAEEEEWEDDSDMELSQGEDITTDNIWVNPLVPELVQDPHAGLQEGPGCPTSMGTQAAGEADSDRQNASPAPAGPTDAEPAASALAGAPEEEGHHAPLAPAAQEEAKAPPASPAFGEQVCAPALPVQVASEHRGDAQRSSGCRDVPEDDPGITALPHAPARQQRPSVFRRALRALRRAFRCTCLAGQQEQ
ncbi:uncharacterized protein LJ206_002187 [Theristicus caerulescens]